MTDLARIERFLYEEAALLDDGRLEDWLNLFAADGLYWVPASRDEIDPDRDISIIYDNRRRLANRIAWLTSNRAFAQQPRSATVRQVTNITVVSPADPVEEYEVEAVVVIWETRPNTSPQQVATRVGYRLRGDHGELRIVTKKVHLLDPTRHWENLTFLP